MANGVRPEWERRPDGRAVVTNTESGYPNIMLLLYRLTELYDAAPASQEQRTAFMNYVGEVAGEYYRVDGERVMAREALRVEHDRQRATAGALKPRWCGVCWQCGAGSGTLVEIGSAKVLFFLLVHVPWLAWRRVLFVVRTLFKHSAPL